MAEDHNVTVDRLGNIVRTEVVPISPEEALRRGAYQRLLKVSDADLAVPPLGPIIADILRQMGYK